jgi:hypothetical protein
MVDQSFLKLCLSHVGKVWTDSTYTGIGQKLIEEQLNWEVG